MLKTKKIQDKIKKIPKLFANQVKLKPAKIIYFKKHLQRLKNKY